MQADGKSSVFGLGLQNTPEQLEPVLLDVKGTIPPWVTGSLYRTGPGTFDIPMKNGGIFHVSSWFDGIGMNHKFEIKEGGQVWYRSRKSGDRQEKLIAETGRFSITTFAQDDPCETTFQKFSVVFDPAVTPETPEQPNHPSSISPAVTLTADMPGVSLPASHSTSKSTSSGPGYIVAKTDADVYQVLDADTLEPLVLSTYGDMDTRLKDGSLCGAHSCTDPKTRDFYNYVSKPGRETNYTVFRIRGSGAERGKVDVLAEIKDAPMAYIHSTGMTEKYYILTVWQADVIECGIPKEFNNTLLSRLNKKWNPDRLTQIYVIDRREGGVVAKYTAPAFFAFHYLNSYDDGDDVVVDLTVYKDIDILFTFSVDKLRHPVGHAKSPKSVPMRLRLPSVSSRPQGSSALVQFQVSESKNMELPSINPAYAWKKYRYAYAISISGDPKSVVADQLLKIDVEHSQISSQDAAHDGSSKFWKEDMCVPGEPIFVPNPDGTDEDDGVVLSVVLDGKSKRSMLLVLDARDMKELARAEMTSTFPLGFHGTFYSHGGI